MSDHRVNIGSATVTLHDVELPMGLVLDRIEVDAVAMEIDGGHGIATWRSPAQAVATLSAARLAQFLAAKAPGGLHSFSAVIRGGKIMVQAIKTVLIDIKATAVCHLRVAEGRQVSIEIEAVEALGGAALTQLVRNQVEAMNPIFDVEVLPVAAIIQSIESDDDQIRVRMDVTGMRTPEAVS